MKKIVYAFIVFVLFGANIGAQGVYELIDTPTADVLDSHSFDISFRFYSGGGVLSKAFFGVVPRVNVGFSWDIARVIGTGKVDVQEPALNLKYRFFDGNMFVPAFALGYDGQGYLFDEGDDEYLHREKGVFAAASNEIFFPGLQYNIGGYIYDFKEDKFFGFAGLTLLAGDMLALLAEYDNIRNSNTNRFNGGIRLYVTPLLFVDLAGRDMGAKGRDAERIVRISYLGSF